MKLQDIIENMVAADMQGSAKPIIQNIEKKIKPCGFAFGHDVFDCDDDTYIKAINGKTKYSRYDHFLGADNELVSKIREYVKENPSKQFILRNRKTTECAFALKR